MNAAETDLIFSLLHAAIGGQAQVHVCQEDYVTATELFRQSLAMMSQTLPKHHHGVISGNVHI